MIGNEVAEGVSPRHPRWGTVGGALLLLVAGLVGAPPAEAQAGPGGRGGGAAIQILSLEDAVRAAMEQSRELRQADLALDEAAGQVAEAWSQVYPRVDLSTTYTRNISPAVSFLPAIIFDPDAPEGELLRVPFGADNQWGGSLAFEQPLFQAQAFIGVGAAGRYEALQEEGLRDAVHEVVTRIRLLYYELLLAQEQARLIERSLERVVQVLEETRSLQRAGLASEFEVLRLEVEAANLEPQLRRTMNEVRRTEREMATELDLPPGTTVRLEGALAEMELDEPAENDPANRRILEFAGVEPAPEVEPGEVDRLLERARVGSTILQQASLNEDLRRAELRAEQAEYLPRVFLFGTYDVQAQQDGSPQFFGASGQRGYGRHVGIRVSIPLFTGFERGARVDRRRATLRSAQVERDLAEDRLRDELETLLEAVEEARIRARAQRLAVEQATRGYEIASAEYREGLVSRLELTDAEVALRQSEVNYAEAVFDYLSSRARLDRTVGEVPVPGGGRRR